MIPSVYIYVPFTQRETSVELQVCGEESSETAEQFATCLPSVQLIAAVDKAIGRGAIVGFVQNPYQQLPLADHHLKGGRSVNTTLAKLTPNFGRYA